MYFKHELVIPNDDLPYKLFVFEGKEGNYNVAKHWHRSIEIFLVLEGEIEFFINSTPHTLVQGEFILVNSNEIHSINAPLPNYTLVLQIPHHLLEAYRESEYVLFKTPTNNKDEAIKSLIESLYYIYSEKSYGYELELKSYFYKLLHVLITKYKLEEVDSDTLKRNKNLDKLSEIINYIKRNYKEDLTLEGVAEKFAFSPTYLSRIFQKYASINYKSYLLNVRVEFAYKELCNTEATIGEIAINNGFPDSRSFSKTFYKRYGLLPSDYRKEMKKRQKSAIH
ncbi:AraC family transcriptional regulator [Sporanaerobium hydrogeniformans]|uniref:AraC family transcriptional regulator n=1 Tax=Sporanaerobium hydrogeniformans TaxID=3072179 RepID=A0AC61D9B8_9FIRM|nr:AraC family transcriptional regulator [Sporanaerobium hydrogeniformans]PHV69291.1 AraC family transcriptional regulator [Sporanaerobium hydrogeniformans]